MAKSSKIKGIEDFGYGKGYIAALDHWRVLIRKLEALREKGMNVILIAHSVRKMFKNPIGEDYEQWTLKLKENATGLFVEWSRIIAYCDWDVATEETSGRVKAQTTGKRLLRTQPNPAFLAKARTVKPLPERIALERRHGWKAFDAALALAGEDDAATIITLKSVLEDRIKLLADNDVESKVRAFVKENGETTPTLNEAIERLDITIVERRKAS